MAEKTKAELEAEIEAMKAQLEAAQADKAKAEEAKAETDKLLEQAQAATKDAQDELSQLKAEQAAHQDGDTEQAASEPDPGDELVPVRLFKDNDKYKDDVFVAVNGQRIQIQRGKTVMVKKKFADVLEQSMAQDERTASMIERESREYQQQANKLGV